MARRRRVADGQNLPVNTQESQPQKVALRDDNGGQRGDGVHLRADDGEAKVSPGVPKASRKPRGKARRDPEVTAPTRPLPEPFKSAGCNCAACPYSKDGQPRDFLLALGPRLKPDGLLVLGGGPNRDEVKQQEHLAGMLGKEMAGALMEAGLQKERLLITHAYACQPIEPKKDKFERAATNACRPLILKLIESIPPETPTLLAGKWALLSVTGREKGLFTSRGFVDMKWSLKDGAASEIKEVEAGEVEGEAERTDERVWGDYDGDL